MLKGNSPPLYRLLLLLFYEFFSGAPVFVRELLHHSVGLGWFPPFLHSTNCCGLLPMGMQNDVRLAARALYYRPSKLLLLVWIASKERREHLPSGGRWLTHWRIHSNVAF
jgi:hypothetical protein